MFHCICTKQPLSPFGSSWKIYLKIYTAVEEERFPFQTVFFSFREEEGWGGKGTEQLSRAMPRNICKLDKASVHIVKRQNSCVHHSSLELRNVYWSFLFINKYLLVEHILSSLVIRETPETAISWTHLNHIYILCLCMCEEYAQGTHFYQRTRGGVKTPPHAVFPSKGNQYNNKSSLQREN